MKNTKQIIVLLTCSTALTITIAGAQASTVYYDIAGAVVNQRSLDPHYVAGSQTAIAASSLQASPALSNPNSSDLGVGNFVFANWPGAIGSPCSEHVPTFIEFDLTAKTTLNLNSMKYTFFLGDWSSMDGPHVLTVAASKDGFASWSYVGDHGAWGVGDMRVTTPYDHCPNNLVDNLSSLGTINPGQTVAFRFYASWGDYGSIPAGLWNKSSDNYNLTVDFTTATPVPEPSTYVTGLSALGIFGVAGWRNRKSRFGWQ